MKIVMLNTSVRMGGAATACLRLMTALSKSGHECNALVLNYEDESYEQYQPASQSKWSKWTFYLEKLLFLRHEKNERTRFQFSTAQFGHDVSQHPLIKDADIIHIHWVSQGFLSLQNIETLTNLNKLIVWTLHDMWAFTGGCHYTGTCMNYKNQCGNCQFLKTQSRTDLSYTIWNKKNNLRGYKSINFVTCSEWLANRAKESSLLGKSNICSIANPIDTDIYKPSGNSITDRRYVLFQSMNIDDERKGFKYLIDALQILIGKYPKYEETITLLVFGKGSEKLQLESNICIESLGLLRDENVIISTYQRASVFIIPSLEDNLPNTVMESLACGTPVAGFDTGGIPEMVEHKKNGYIAAYKNAADLANGINWILEDTDRYNSLKLNARTKVLQKYSEKVISEKYTGLYQSLMDMQ